VRRGRPLRAESRTHVTADKLTPRERDLLMVVGARSSCPTIRFSPHEYAFVRRIAMINNQTFSQFARDAIVTAASECSETAPPASLKLKS
jgi:hypothetical protein